MKHTRTELSLAPLYLLVDADEKNVVDCGSAPDCLPRAGKLRVVHVMSPPAGGQVRGYWLHDGALYLWSPCYEGEWPEVDEATARALGAAVVPYVVDAGGGVILGSRDEAISFTSPPCAHRASAPVQLSLLDGLAS